MFKVLAATFLLVLTSNYVNAQGKPTGESDRLENGVPDYHQFEAKIIEIIDADTLKAEIYLIPGIIYTVDVRVKGVDAPESHRPKCDWEEKLANEATEAVAKRFPIGSWVYIENVEEDSFSGRIVADIKQWYGNQRWRSVSDVLLSKEGRWGVKSKKGQNDFDWCKTLPAF